MTNVCRLNINCFAKNFRHREWKMLLYQ